MSSPLYLGRCMSSSKSMPGRFRVPVGILYEGDRLRAVMRHMKLVGEGLAAQSNPDKTDVRSTVFGQQYLERRGFSRHGNQSLARRAQTVSGRSPLGLAIRPWTAAAVSYAHFGIS